MIRKRDPHFQYTKCRAYRAPETSSVCACGARWDSHHLRGRNRCGHHYLAKLQEMNDLDSDQVSSSHMIGMRARLDVAADTIFGLLRTC